MNLTKVIQYIRACQRTHTDSVRWYDDGNDFVQWLSERSVEELEQMFGDREFHAQCVKDYGRVLNYLESIQERHDIE